jgi:hypothetical protein
MNTCQQAVRSALRVLHPITDAFRHNFSTVFVVVKAVLLLMNTDSAN